MALKVGPICQTARKFQSMSLGNSKYWVQKYILNKKRGDVIEDFKQKNPECKFSKQILNREWPQNVVTPSTRDLNRNVCPIHSNARRIEKCLKKHGLLADTPSSCRLMSAQRIGQKYRVNAIFPLSWKKKWVYCLYKESP